MVMDYIRTPYRRKCRLFRDSDETVTLSWYAAPPGAKIFPGHHLFASGDWCDKKLDWPGPGEVRESKRWWTRGGSSRPYKGQCFVGEREWYNSGLPADAIPAQPGLPDCCSGPPLIGGLDLAGRGVVSSGRNLRTGGLSLSSNAEVTQGRLSVSEGGVALAGAALVVAGRGGVGYLWGGYGPGGWLLGGWGGPSPTGLLFAGEAPATDTADNDGEGGLSLGGEGLATVLPANSGKGGLAWGGKADVQTYDPNSILTPACSNRIPYGIVAFFDECWGSLVSLTGSYHFIHTTGYVWQLATPALGNGSVRFQLNFGVYSPGQVQLACNCIYISNLVPLSAQCYPLHMQFKANIPGSGMQCGIQKVAGGFTLTLSAP